MPPMDTANTPLQFGTDEILWYNNGKWGAAGYAVWNPAKKTWTENTYIRELHMLAGRGLFELMHRPDVKSSLPPGVQWLWDAHQLVTVARKRIGDMTQAPNDTTGLTTQHVSPAQATLLAYPVPFFGERIRNSDARQYCEIILMMLSEMAQQSDNEVRQATLSQAFAAEIGKYLQEIIARMGMKYFGFSRLDAYKPDFLIPKEKFAAYDPSQYSTSFEMSEERPPSQWWPTENDLSDIRNLSILEVMPFAHRWPDNQPTQGNEFNPVTNQNANAITGSFVAAPGAAPTAK